MSQILLYLLAELTSKLFSYLNFTRSSEHVVSPLKRKAETDSGPSARKPRGPGLMQRQPSLITVDGFGQSIGVLTSGGDAQGMCLNL